MKRKIAIPVILVLALVLMGAILAQADDPTQTSSVTVTLNATVSEYAYLSFDKTTVNFANTTPAASGTIAPITGDVTTTVTAQLRCLTGAGTLVVKAGNFTSGTDTIPITAVKTAASGITGGSFFTTGTVPWTNAGASTGQTLGGGSSGSYSAILTYTLDNSWSYSVGSYTTTAQFILTAP